MDDNDARLKVLVCHEAPLVGAGIGALLRSHGDMAVTLCTDAAALPWRNGHFQVVVADYSGGLLCARDPAPRPHEGRQVLVVTGQGSEWEIRHAVASGVRGYLLADCAGPALERAVRTVAAGARFFDDVVSSRMAESLMHATLTQREHEVLQLLASGCGNKTIAQRLDIAVGTVKAHVKAILEKLHVRTRMQAAALATERGMLRVPPPVARSTATQRSRSALQPMAS